ncbi:MAG: hypothetical protein ACRD2L_17785, partial [Terriglobia bacterium]
MLRDEAARDQVTRIYDQLFPTAVADDLPQQSKRHGTELAKVEGVLAVIQAAAIYTPVADDTFTLFGRRMRLDYPSASGLVIGSAKDVVADMDMEALTEQFLSLLEHRCVYDQKEDLRKSALHESVKWTDTIRDDVRTLLHKSGLNLEIFECLAYCADGLLGKKHEGENLSFRLALGTDEGLRQYLSPIFGKSGLGESKDRKFFRVPLPLDPDEKGLQRLTNSLDRLIAVIQGNYSFAQDDSLYLCMAYGQQEIQVRYLAQLNPRVQRAGGETLSRTVS